MKALFQINLVIDVPPPTSGAQVDIKKLDMAKMMAEKYLKSVCIPVVNSEYVQPRKLTKEERIAFVPLAVHFEKDYTTPTACLRYTARKVTKDWKKVTCKECLKRKAKSAQAELF
jgi:hypothetical protein